MAGQDIERRRKRCLKTLVLVYSGFNVVVGLGLIACGAWMHASNDVYAYITVFVRSINDRSLVAAAALMVTSGVVLFLTAILGIFGALWKNKKMLQLYMLLLFAIFIMLIVAGFMTVALYYNIHKEVKSSMQKQLNRYYAWDSRLGKEWNRVQVKKRCCGADGPWDYEQTSWYEEQNPEPDLPATVLVPDSCCRLNSYQDSVLRYVNPQDLQLKDAQRCQEDASGKIGNSQNVHTTGCFAALFRKNPDLWHDVSILTVMTTIQGLCLSAGFLQVFGIGFAYWFLSVLQPLQLPVQSSGGGKL